MGKVTCHNYHVLLPSWKYNIVKFYFVWPWPIEVEESMTEVLNLWYRFGVFCGKELFSCFPWKIKLGTVYSQTAINLALRITLCSSADNSHWTNQHNTSACLAFSSHIFKLAGVDLQLHFLQLKGDRHLHFAGEGTGLLQT